MSSRHGGLLEEEEEFVEHGEEEVHITHPPPSPPTSHALLSHTPPSLPHQAAVEYEDDGYSDDDDGASSSVLSEEGRQPMMLSLEKLPSLELSDLVRLRHLFFTQTDQVTGESAPSDANTIDVARALHQIWPQLTRPELDSVIDKIDQDATGYLSFDDLLGFFAHHCHRLLADLETRHKGFSNIFLEPSSLPPPLSHLGHAVPLSQLLHLPCYMYTSEHAHTPISLCSSTPL